MTVVTGKNAYVHLPGGECVRVEDFKLSFTLTNIVTVPDREVSGDDITIEVY